MLVSILLVEACVCMLAATEKAEARNSAEPRGARPASQTNKQTNKQTRDLFPFLVVHFVANLTTVGFWH